MGFKNEYMEINLGTRTDAYYKSIGYEIPTYINDRGKPCSRGLKLKIFTKDLTFGSAKHISYLCDGCGKELSITMNDYTSHNHGGKYYCRKCTYEYMSGENHHSWNSNLSEEERQKGRNYPEYHETILKTLARDHYTCKVCGSKEKLNVHHLNGYNWYKDGRCDESNCITLCCNCHSNFHAKYGYKHSTREQFDEWIGYVIETLKFNGKISSGRAIYCFEDCTIYSNVREICEKYNHKPTTIYNVCNHKKKCKTWYGLHLCWYDEFIKMSENDKRFYMNTSNDGYVKIIELDTGIVFNKAIDACRKYDLDPSDLTTVCDLNTSRTTIGGRHFLYYDDYLNLSKDEIKNILLKNENRIVCLNTGTIYDGIKSAEREYNITGISDVCRHKVLSCGNQKYGVKLYFMYYKEFVCKPLEEQRSILQLNPDNNIEELLSFSSFLIA